MTDVAGEDAVTAPEEDPNPSPGAVAVVGAPASDSSRRDEGPETGAGTLPERIPTDVPPEWQALMRLAARVHDSSFVPKALRGKPGDVLACMMHGRELGLAPITALRSIHVIEGVPTASAQLMRALIQQRGHVLQWREVSTERVVLYGRRRDTGADALVVWTLDDARRAKLLGKGNWSTYPRAMLAARATSEIARLLFADLLHGLAYLPEEVGGVGPYDAIDVSTDYGGEVLTPDATPTPADLDDAEWVAAAQAAADQLLDRELLRDAAEPPVPDPDEDERRIDTAWPPDHPDG